MNQRPWALRERTPQDIIKRERANAIRYFIELVVFSAVIYAVSVLTISLPAVPVVILVTVFLGLPAFYVALGFISSTVTVIQMYRSLRHKNEQQVSDEQARRKTND